MLRSKVVGNAAGLFNKLVVVEKATNAAPNSTHEVVPEFKNTESRWAELVCTSAREFVSAMQVTPMLSEIVKLRYDTFTKKITAKDRLRIGERILNIAGVWNENETNEKIVIWCVEIPA